MKRNIIQMKYGFLFSNTSLLISTNKPNKCQLLGDIRNGVNRTFSIIVAIFVKIKAILK